LLSVGIAIWIVWPKFHDAGSILGRQPIERSDQSYCFVIQFAWKTSIRYPRFAVIWKSNNSIINSKDDLNTVVSINGHKIGISGFVGGIWVMKGDYTLEQVDLDSKETEDMFQMLQNSDRLSFEDDPIWRMKIEPKLVTIKDRER
jgi:hypothetical protein